MTQEAAITEVSATLLAPIKREETSQRDVQRTGNPNKSSIRVEHLSRMKSPQGQGLCLFTTTSPRTMPDPQRELSSSLWTL